MFFFDRLAARLGRSICVMSPVTTAFEPKPMRVRNIFICSGVVFCASSRMTNASLSVRPRMNASGAISIVRRARELRGDLLGLHHVVERVVERAQVRIDLLREVAGQEAEALARFDGRAHEHDALDLVALERIDRTRPRDTSCRCRRADAESSIIFSTMARLSGDPPTKISLPREEILTLKASSMARRFSS
jgi:hypothetical protein